MESYNPIRFCLQPGLCRVLLGPANQTGAVSWASRGSPGTPSPTRGLHCPFLSQVGVSISLEPGSRGSLESSEDSLPRTGRVAAEGQSPEVGYSGLSGLWGSEVIDTQLLRHHIKAQRLYLPPGKRATSPAAASSVKRAAPRPISTPSRE